MTSIIFLIVCSLLVIFLHVPTYRDLFVSYQLPNDTKFYSMALTVRYSSQNFANEKLKKIELAIFEKNKHENITIISIAKL